MTYEVARKVLGLSKIYQRGKTHIPSDVRKVLNLKDGDKLLWILIEGKVSIERS